MTAAVLAGEPPFLEGYDRLRDGFARVGPEWVAGLRAENRERFSRQGIPGPYDENWRFTGLKPLRKATFAFVDESPAGPAGSPAPATSAAPARLSPLTAGETECSRLVFVNGVYAPELSQAAADTCPETQSLDHVLREHPEALVNRMGALADTARHPFAALNTAYLREGAVVRIPGGTWAGRTHLVFVSLPGAVARAVYPRVLVILEDGAEAVLVEEYVGSETVGEGTQPTFSAPVAEVFVGRNAGLEHYRVVRESPESIHLGLLAVRLERDSRYTSHAFSLGGRLLRLDLDVTLAGEGSEAVLNGLYLTRGTEHADHHTWVDHAAAHTQSRELYKGVLAGASTAVFNGRVMIRPGTQKVDAGQVNKNLLLSDQALVNTNPELEIFSDDVKAQHGATVGQIEEDPLFYLRSRGIPEEEARRVLIEAFTGEMIDRVKATPVRERLHSLVAARLENGAGDGLS